MKGIHDGVDLSKTSFTWATAVRRSWWPSLAAVAIFLMVNVLFYSSFFTYREGVSAALKSFAPWRRVALEQHVSVWSVHLWWLWQEESPTLILGAIGISLALWRADNNVAVFVALWAVGMFTAYSVIPYKTPWLTLNIILPLAIVGGHGVEVLRAQAHSSMRTAMVLGAAGFVAVVGYQTIILNFVRYDDDRYPYVFGHTRRETLTLVREIERVVQRSGGRQVPTIAITSPDQFPLSWYLRDYPVGYYGQLLPVTDPIVIGSEDQADELQSLLGASYHKIGAYSLRPGVTLVLFVRQDLLAGEPLFPLSRCTPAEQS